MTAHDAFPSLLPHDAADAQLASLVHPADWQNPVPAARYHLVVVGAGTGGLVTAAAAAGLGARVALVERGLMGGDCLNVGCVPSKALLRAARAWDDVRTAPARFGAPASTSPGGDFAAVMTRLRQLRAQLARIDGAARFRSLGVDVFLGHARFTAREAIEVDGAVLRFRRAVIATGARATVPDIPGLAESGFHTNETIFTLTTPPAHLVVIGGGPIGCELAQAFARLGSAVTLVNRGARLLSREDADVSAVLEAALRDQGVRVLSDATVHEVRRERDGTTVHVTHGGAREVVSCDTLLVAAGRTPNVHDLGLDAAGVAYDHARGVQVNDRLQTSNRRVYAVGDVCASLQFTHAADFQARLVVQNALFFGRGRASALVTPRVTYTSPEVGHVGLTDAEAAAQGVETDVVDVPMHDVDRAVLDGDTAGFCRVRVARGTDRLVGITVVGAHAGEIIGEATLAMTAGLGLAAIGRTMHPYPTRGEVLRKAADAWRRRKLTPRVTRLLARYFAWWS